MPLPSSMEGKVDLFRGYHYPMEVYWETHRKGGFTQLSLDLTSGCNYRCTGCFNGHLLGKDPSDMLAFEERKSLLEQSVELGARTLVIPGTGEPTLDRDFYRLVECAHGLGLTTVVYSNLTGNINPERVHFLFEHDVSIGIKFDTLRPEYFRRYYQARPSAYPLFLGNSEAIFRYYGHSHENTDRGAVHRAILNVVLSYENMAELPELVERGLQEGFPLYVRPIKPVDWAVRNPEDWMRLGNRSGNFVPDPVLVELARQHNHLFSPSSTLENHCAIYSFGLTVKNNGDVQACPDHHDSRGAFGNVRKSPLREIMGRLTGQRKIQPGFCVMLPEISH